MADRKRYGQFCAAARALDHIGDRWTLLIVRELLLGPARYGELSAALPGLATNLLAQRLRQLTDDGIVERNGGSYRLTPRGAALEPVLLELIRWGAAYMPEGVGDDLVDERWARLALRAMLQGPSDAPRGTVAVRCGDVSLVVVVDEHGRRVADEAPDRPRATVRAPMPALLAAVALDAWGDDVVVDGDAKFAHAALGSPQVQLARRS